MKKIMNIATKGRIPGIVLTLGVAIVVFKSIATILTTFWGALGLMLMVAGYFLLKEQEKRATPPAA